MGRRMLSERIAGLGMFGSSKALPIASENCSIKWNGLTLLCKKREYNSKLTNFEQRAEQQKAYLLRHRPVREGCTPACSRKPSCQRVNPCHPSFRLL
jgi:hypothetical protein